MERLIERIRESGRALVYPPTGLPTLPEGLNLSSEVESFYNLCGGILFTPNIEFPIRILSPERFRLANSEMFAGFSDEEVKKTLHHISWSWFVVAECESDHEEKVVIDLSITPSPCYDCYWATYPGDSEEITPSFSKFLEKLLEYDGDFIFWK